MGRRRKDASQGLPQRVYLRSGTFYYVHASTGKWENIGRDLTQAKKRAEHYNDPTGAYGTFGWFYDQFLIHFGEQVALKLKAPRTLKDYMDAAAPLKAFFGQMLPTEIGPHHITEFLDIGLRAGRAVRANREKAAMSSCLSWLLRTNQGGLAVNPCMQASGVKRNPESARERYVTHDEYRATYAAASATVRLAMELVYRTLQRPEEDVLQWTPANVQHKGGGRVLRFRQHKTGRQMDIALVGELERLVDAAIGPVPQLRQPIVHNRKGQAYGYTGLMSNLHRAQQKAGVVAFGLRDLKGKGATDMWLDGVPIEQIQMLCGHANKATTERYIKARWRETAQPNNREVG